MPAGDHSTVCSSTPEQAATHTATAGTTASETASEADSEADSSLVTSVNSKLPDLSVPTKTLLPEQGHLGQPQESAPPGFNHADPQHDVHHMGLLSQQQLPAELASLLDETADR